MSSSRLLSVFFWMLCLPALAAPGGPAVSGAGATFPQPVYAAWAQAFGWLTGLEVNYEPVGSGEGVKRVERGEVDFGASDVPLADAELQRQRLIQFPAVVGAIVPVFNMRGLKDGELRLNGAVLGDIYGGKIRRWDDAALVALNPGVALPSEYITVVHRDDASGTSFLWTTYLSRHNAQWRSVVGASTLPKWPLGVGGSGNAGVASYVERTRGAIGYVEYAYAKAHHLTSASLPGPDGAFVVPGPISFRAAVAAARWDGARDLTQSLIEHGGAASWPLTGASFILVRLDPAGRERRRDVLRFFGWALSRGQGIAEALDYVALPMAAVNLIEAQWRSTAGLAPEDLDGPGPPSREPR